MRNPIRNTFFTLKARKACQAFILKLYTFLISIFAQVRYRRDVHQDDPMYNKFFFPNACRLLFRIMNSRGSSESRRVNR